MNINLSDLPEFGSFALVIYLPDPLGEFLRSLRHLLPGDENPQAHITVLPPRPLQSPVDRVSFEAQRILSGFDPFRVVLSGLKSFPDTNILYLAVAGGNEELHEVHDALNRGILAHEESFDFLPHLTLSGPVAADQLGNVRAEAKKAITQYRRQMSFEANEVVALWQPLYGSWDEWNRVWAQKLGDSGSSASAGR